jgi:hypothetical protein
MHMVSARDGVPTQLQMIYMNDPCYYCARGFIRQAVFIVLFLLPYRNLMWGRGAGQLLEEPRIWDKGLITACS